jgi:tyrosine phenol-lyase
MKTIIEPFRIKMVEPIKMTTRDMREKILTENGFNPFLIKAEDVIIDLLTDSGTGAMSASQWAGMMEGDESYAGGKSFYRFQESVQDLTGFKNVIPTHQGRAAERILFGLVGKPGKFIPNNAHFDTTRANIEYVGAVAQDFPIAVARQPSVIDPFKGNMDNQKLLAYIKEKGPENIPLVMTTVTNNTGGGQPVSLANMRETSAICKEFKIPYFIDACRFAENTYFIKIREKGQENRSVKEIAQEMFRLADGATMSGKKDGHVNMGGFLALNDDKWAEGARNLLILTEGFPTYGGLAGRDLEAYAIGLREVLDEDYLKYRIRSVQYTGEKLTAAGVPLILPPGGHAVYIDALHFLPHIPRSEFPGQALSCELYLAGGIRGVEIGSVMFGKAPPAPDYEGLELVRLALPRRVYTQSHMDYVCEVIVEVFKNRNQISGLKMTYEAPTLRHFTARFVRTKK